MRTIEELRDLVRRILGEATEELLRTGSVFQRFYLVRKGGGMDLVLIDSDITNDEKEKSALGKGLRRIVEGGEIEAVVMASDVFYAKDIAPEANKVREALGLNIEQAHAMGLCEKREALLVTLESPIFAGLARQEYRREGGRPALDGEPLIVDGENCRFGAGRFSGVFRWPAGHA